MTAPITRLDHAIDARVAALRATAGESHAAERTRQRIASTLVHRKRQRRQRVTLALLVVLGLPLGTTAYAAFFGTPAIVEYVLVKTGLMNVPAPTLAPKRLRTSSSESAPQRSKAAPTPPQATPGVDPPTLPPESKPTAPVPTAPPSIAQPLTTPSRAIKPVRRARATDAAQQPPIATPPPDPSEALYERAHALHFVERNWAQALLAWDAYLQRAPTPTLAVEAEYNRALCLVRLQRMDEALAALTPFANGAHGRYRQREAAALIEALSRSR